jgi:hypothetical protein
VFSTRNCSLPRSPTCNVDDGVAVEVKSWGAVDANLNVDDRSTSTYLDVDDRATSTT